MKILIAEDEQSLNILYKKLMARWDFDFDFVTNGKDAVEQVVMNREQYDICLMDIDMPIMNGFEAAQLIRQKAKYIPILAVTGNSSIKNKYAEFGMDDYLRKPFDFDELYNKINELTVKSEKIIVKENEIAVEKEMPMDREHAEELRELAKKDLRKVKFFDIPGSTVIVHKNVTNKISHDFNVKKQLMSLFINRDPEMPTRCELYKESNNLMPQVFITEEEYDKLIKEENQELQNYSNPALKGEEE